MARKVDATSEASHSSSLGAGIPEPVIFTITAAWDGEAPVWSGHCDEIPAAADAPTLDDLLKKISAMALDLLPDVDPAASPSPSRASREQRGEPRVSPVLRTPRFAGERIHRRDAGARHRKNLGLYYRTTERCRMRQFRNVRHLARRLLSRHQGVPSAWAAGRKSGAVTARARAR